MKKQTIFNVLFLMPAFFANSCGQSDKKIQVVKPALFQELLKTGDNLVLLDVRTPEEYNSGAIANAVNIDFYETDFSDKLSKLDKSKTYLVYCRSGKRSNKTANMLIDQGFKNVVDLDGGIIAWQEAGMSVK